MSTQLTKKRIAGMLKENTGVHFLDSGMSNGRAWQRNQGRDFEKELPVIFHNQRGESIMDVIEHREEHERTDEEIEDLLNDIYGEVKICGFTYDSGHLLKLVDPIAFSMADSDDPLPDTITYECGVCGALYDEGSEDEAQECCLEEPEEDEEV